MSWQFDIIKALPDNGEFSRKHLWDLARHQLAHDIPNSSIAWYIFNLKKEGLIENTARGRYRVSKRSPFRPMISDKMRSIFKTAGEKYPFAICCVSDTAWFNDWMVHQVFKTAMIIEIEKEAASPLFNELSATENGVFYRPDELVIAQYMQLVDKPIVILPLISQAPVTAEKDVIIPTIEKLLVDLLAEKAIYASQQTEAGHIYAEVIRRYPVNESTLMRYARRRNRAEQVNALFHQTKQTTHND